MTVGYIIEITEQSLKIEVVDEDQNVIVEAENNYYPSEVIEAEVMYLQPEWDRKVLRIEIKRG